MIRELPYFTVTPTVDPQWTIVEHGFDMEREHEIESLFTVSNGRLGVRGSLAEGAPLSSHGTFAAGFYTHPGASPDVQLAVLPNWIAVHAHGSGHTVSLTEGKILRHVRTLDMRNGLQWREWLHEDPLGRVTLIFGVRAASLADRRLLFQAIHFASHNFSGRLTVEAGLERNSMDGASSAETIADPKDDFPVLVVRYHPPMNVATAAEYSRIVTAQNQVVPCQTISNHENGFQRRWTLNVGIGDSMRFERVSSIATSTDGNPLVDEVRSAVSEAAKRGFDPFIEAHATAWQRRWATADIEIDGDPVSQRSLRFAIYHLLAAGTPDDANGHGARGLTGSGYKGHVFWDAEVFALPFYFHVEPQSALPQLLYRYNTLNAARKRAKEHGYDGAFFAWESADTGDDVTPELYLTPTGDIVKIECGHLEQHINADIAWAVWSYWRATGDDDFLLNCGAEIFIETARFWRSRVTVETDGKAHIRKVIGPDEYHIGVDDNAYTNRMARWNLEHAVRVAQWLRESYSGRYETLRTTIGLNDEEVESWRNVGKTIYEPFDPASGIIEQFQGYFGLQGTDSNVIPLAPLAPALGASYQGPLIKQPDTLLLFQLLPDEYPEHIVAKNFAYYDRRTVHGSSLSPGTHALLAARLGLLDRAIEYFVKVSQIDLANNLGNAASGVHFAAIGSLWQATLFGFAGMRFDAQGIGFLPHLPPAWNGLRFHVHWRGRLLQVEIKENGRRMAAKLLEGDSIQVRFGGQSVMLRRGEGTQFKGLEQNKRGAA